MTDTPVDPQRCPLCGAANQCTLTNPATATLPCWCFSTPISADALARIPAEARQQACLCPACAQLSSRAVDAS